MKSSIASQIYSPENQNKIKPQLSREEIMQKENSRQPHINPLKMKTSFLRQSLTLNNNDKKNLLNSNTSSSIHRNSRNSQPSLVVQPDPKLEFMMKKIIDQFSNNPNPKYHLLPEHSSNLHQMHKNRQIIKLLGRKNQHFNINRSSYEDKQNNHSQSVISSVNQSGNLLTLNDSKVGKRVSQQSNMQSFNINSSFVDYTNSTKFSSQSGDGVSLVKDQLQLILKRLAKNQCEIEALKRDKNFDMYMEGVWKQLSVCQGKIQMIQRRNSKTDQKITKYVQQMEQIKVQLSKLNWDETLWSKNVQLLQRRIDSFSEIGQNQDKSSMNHERMIAQLSRIVKNQIDAVCQKLSFELSAKLLSRFNQLHCKVIQDKVLQPQLHKNIKNTQLRLGFEPSNKKAHYFISLVYKEVLQINKKLDLSLFKQASSLFSDRSNLLVNVLNDQNRKRLSHCQLVISQQKSVEKNPGPQFQQSKKDYSGDVIEINQVEYFIDNQGYLLDKDQFYLLNGVGEQIKIDSYTLDLLRKNKILQN